MNLESALVKFDLDLRNLITSEMDRDYPSQKKKYPEYKSGKKYIKIIRDTSCWGFISKEDGFLKGSPIKVGDLLKSAGWSTPAKHSRGNIIDGTASYSMYGPSYLK
jgi:hypothetical protein